MAQMKEQIKISGKELNKIEISNLLNAELKMQTGYKGAQRT